MLELWFGVGVVLLVVWIVKQSSKSSEQRRQELENWEHVEHEPPFRFEWSIHWPTMRMRYSAETTDDPDAEEYEREYVLRRNANGEWSITLTPSSHKRERWWLRQRVIDNDARADEYAKSLEKLEKGRKSEPVRDDLVPMIETAYQRYIRTR